MKSRLKILVAALAVIALLVGLLAYPHYRAKSAVRAYRDQLQRQGEKMRVEEVAPVYSADQLESGTRLLKALAPLGPVQNYPRVMAWISPGHALVGWAETNLVQQEASNAWPELTQGVKVYAGDIAAVRRALEGPSPAFALNYQQSYSIPITHLAPLKRLTLWLAAAISVNLHEHEATGAWSNVIAEAQFESKYQGEPLMISQLVRYSGAQIAIASTWEALQFPGWSDLQLAELQEKWESFDFLANLEPSLVVERNSAEGGFASFRGSFTLYRNQLTLAALSGTPTAGGSLDDLLQRPLETFRERWRFAKWNAFDSYEEELVTLHHLQAATEAARLLSHSDAAVPVLTQFDLQVSNLLAAHADWEQRFLFSQANLVSNATTDDMEHRFIRRAVEIETARRMLITAIALERYRLRRGQYPAKLADLTPDILRTVALDPMDGEPLRYRRREDGTFQLYSVGDDGKDDGGDSSSPAGTAAGSTYWLRMRDIVWPSPATPAEVADYEKRTFARGAPKRSIGWSSQTNSLPAGTNAPGNWIGHR